MISGFLPLAKGEPRPPYHDPGEIKRDFPRFINAFVLEVKKQQTGV
jgi:hypothetical protein